MLGITLFERLKRSSFSIKDLCTQTPLQAHFGTLLEEDSKWANELDRAWSDRIRESGGFHARGLHVNEERVFTYAQQKSGFLESAKMDYDVDLAWRRTFDFFRRHLKEI